MPFNRSTFFDSVRSSLFGKLTQQQVDGMNFKLDEWEAHYSMNDMRHCAYAFATSYHETAATMWPIEEYGKGKGSSYGVPDPQTKQTYYGRGDVQLTWKDNYIRATKELGLSGANDLEWHADRALDPQISANVMYIGMREGWFRGDSSGRQTLQRYFNSTTNDAFGAREIINGDKSKVPSWSNGVSIGKLIQGYHGKFLTALNASWSTEPLPPPEPEPVHVYKVGEVVRTVKGAKYTGTVISVYNSLDGTPHVDVEATVPEFVGTIHVYKTTMIEPVET